MFETIGKTYSEVCNIFEVNSEETWGICFGQNEKKEYQMYCIVEPLEDIKLQINLECAFFFTIEDNIKGFLPTGTGRFTINDQVVYKDFDPFYAPEIDEIPESKKRIDHSNPFSILELMRQFSLAKKYVLMELSEAEELNSDDGESYFSDLSK